MWAIITQKPEQWVNSSYVMSRHAWSFCHVYLQPLEFNWVNGDLQRTPSVWADLLLTKHSQMNRESILHHLEMNKWPWALVCSLQHITLSKAESPEMWAHLPYLEIKSKKNGDGRKKNQKNKLLFQQSKQLTFENFQDFQTNLFHDRLDSFFPSFSSHPLNSSCFY